MLWIFLILNLLCDYEFWSLRSFNLTLLQYGLKVFEFDHETLRSLSPSELVFETESGTYTVPTSTDLFFIRKIYSFKFKVEIPFSLYGAILLQNGVAKVSASLPLSIVLFFLFFIGSIFWE